MLTIFVLRLLSVSSVPLWFNPSSLYVPTRVKRGRTSARKRSRPSVRGKSRKLICMCLTPMRGERLDLLRHLVRVAADHVHIRAAHHGRAADQFRRVVRDADAHVAGRHDGVLGAANGAAVLAEDGEFAGVIVGGVVVGVPPVGVLGDDAEGALLARAADHDRWGRLRARACSRRPESGNTRPHRRRGRPSRAVCRSAPRLPVGRCARGPGGSRSRRRGTRLPSTPRRCRECSARR